ncbi:hypothetical protein DVK85_03060 [Flavobacterium arcticum]|uniref:Carboxypeptidase regulatory-like domain-containing protein n=1 Tax=Flavobacterium arcticum TaxID=1784713 RepID=A0A345H9J9_9FLAO|nr:hypothetical protein [Flavobacterium arcticum]AXG73259.1 hypothetical protein DVK85_03060 [Flavobacterium arcticum]KAF2513054.1 hypothetical protein E0W72_01130 [Flavobacterium arcticum]
MKHLLSHKIVLLFLVLISNNLIAQTTKKDEIAKKLTDYFFLERENIHVHFDKDVFLTDESVWFKGYTYHRKNNTPFFACVNIFATLIDNEGNVIESQLLYGNMGTFSGSFKLNDSMKSGRYYVQFYTNWMNNFTEDESFVGEITVVNKNINPSLFNTPNYSKVNIDLHPEGGTLVEGINNNIGISITDCNDKPIPNAKAILVNGNDEAGKELNLNKQGYGKFNLTPDRTKKYKVITTIEGKEYEQTIPPAQLKGVSLEINSYTVPDKTIIKTSINPLMQTSLSGKPLYLVIHKDEKAIITEIDFKHQVLEQTVVMSNLDLFEGLNTIRILDNELNELAERVMYIYPKLTVNVEVRTKPKETDGKIELSGKVNYANMNLSISMLPANTVTIKEHNDIYNSLLIAPYIEYHKTFETKAYLNTISRKNQYELDLFLLNQNSKYKWRNIKNNPPKSNHTFDIGLSLKGTINNSGNLKKYKVKVTSFEGMIDETVDINKENEFYLDNLILADSIKLDFFLVKDDTKKQVKLYPQLFNINRVYNKQYNPKATECSITENNNTISDLPELPDHIDINTIVLDEVELKGTTNKLKYQKAFGNSQLRGYKIGDDERKSFFYILDLIRYHGFNVETSNGTVSITGRTINTINGQATTPMIYIDNMQVLSFDILWNMQTEDIDEFYVNQHAVVPSVNNRMGIIRIYMRKDYSSKAKNNSPASFLVKNGFKRITPFKNNIYLSTATKGFENFGVIDWEPLITTDEKGGFKLELPHTGQNSIKLLIEGISPDGKLISEIKTINLN